MKSFRIGNAHVPSRSSVEGLGGVVPSLAMAAHEKKLVADIGVLVTGLGELCNVALEPLPLGLDAFRVKTLISRVGPVDETKILLGLSGGFSLDNHL
jgi:hypothetical protein